MLWNANFATKSYIEYIIYLYYNYKREKEGDLTQSYDKTPYTNRKLYGWIRKQKKIIIIREDNVQSWFVIIC